VRPLYWYEYGWMALPILLAFAGGGLGALVGLGAAHLNSRIFWSDRAAAVGVFFIVAALAGPLLGGLRKA